VNARRENGNHGVISQTRVKVRSRKCAARRRPALSENKRWDCAARRRRVRHRNIDPRPLVMDRLITKERPRPTTIPAGKATDATEAPAVDVGTVIVDDAKSTMAPGRQ